MMKKCFAALLAALMLLSGASAELTVQDAGLALGAGNVRYPQVTGFDDPVLEAAVNQAVLEGGEIGARLDRITLLISQETSVTTGYDYDAEAFAGGVLSCVFESTGAVTEMRPTHVYNTVNIDLTTGQAITLADLFIDETAAVEALENYMWDEVAYDLSAHLQNSDLTPLPDTFTISDAGITFWYPIRQLSTLSDRAGAVTVLWCEIRDHLRLGEGSILRRIGAEANIMPGTRESVAQALSGGSIPGIPAVLGGSVKEAVDTYRELADSDFYQDGRLFQLEDAAFRRVYLMTDNLSAGWDSSVIRGIRADRANVCGLMCGVTTMDEWRAILGEPDATVVLDADAADAYRLEAGTSDYYAIGEDQLRLHADESGVLQNLFLLD